MAAQFLASHGVDLNEIFSENGLPMPSEQQLRTKTTPISRIINARLPHRSLETLYDISISNGQIKNIESSTRSTLNISHLSSVVDAAGGMVAPSFCHAHVHLDKCFLLHDEKYKDLEIVKGDFAEAMSMTSEAKKRFDENDLLRRGRRLIDESTEAGVTAMRAFVEVDEIVELKCVRASVRLREEYREVCEIQICAFAQLALFSGEDGGARRRELLEQALSLPKVDVVGSTPYVEDDETRMKQNVEWTIAQALDKCKHLDFHLDYNIDAKITPLIWFVLEELKRQDWNAKAGSDRKICFGHCTRLTLFSAADWQDLREEIGDLPISFVGLPMSDLFMMGRPTETSDGGGQRARATLQIPQMIREYGFNGAISINNVGNAFTPQGNCDPLSLATMAVGVYQTGTEKDTELLYVWNGKFVVVPSTADRTQEMISARAFDAIGLTAAPLGLKQSILSPSELQHHGEPLSTPNPANLILFGAPSLPPHRRPQTISEAVYAGGPNFLRRSLHRGRLINQY